MKNTALVLAGLMMIPIIFQCSVKHNTNDDDSLQEAFMHPGESAKPWVYWFWMNANVTAEGITRDLEAMSEMGLGGAYLMPIGEQGPLTKVDNPVNPLSESWWDLVKFSNQEASRLGLKLAMNACDGWALAGGPWITPELSMQEVVSSGIQINGGQSYSGFLPMPEMRENYYRDIAVLAFPALKGMGLTSKMLKPKATTNIPDLDPSLLVERSNKMIKLQREGWIHYEFEKPFTCRSVYIEPGQRSGYQLHRAELQVSDDGINFRSLGRLSPAQYHGWQDDGVGVTHSVKETSARFFRLILKRDGVPEINEISIENHEGAKPRNRDQLNAQYIELRGAPAINHWEGKAGYRWRRSEWTAESMVPSALCVAKESIVDLSNKLDTNGKLIWEVPEGEWTVMRIGFTTTGDKNAPAGTGSGLECDKFNPEAAKKQFNGWFGEALKRVGPEHTGKILSINHTDSWEAKSQNWSPVFKDEFKKRRGYDPVPWLPVLQGIPIESAEVSERFLYDVRRTIADLVCDNFYEPFTKLGAEQGAGFSAECIAPTMMSDGLQHFKFADIPMGEFWLNSVNQDKPNDIMDAIHGGEIYGKRIIGAEAFTQNPMRWNEDPYWLKPIGDHNFATGINRFILSIWAHQAFNRKPGVTLGPIGVFFSGSQTWSKQSKVWVDYLSKCSSMLQQGLPVKDVSFFTGEELPSRSFLRRDLPMDLPQGYSYGSINRDALMNLASVKNNKLVLNGGLSFHILVLPPSSRMSPEMAKKIGELSEAGLTVIASKPETSISLSNYPECDSEVGRIVEEHWKSVQSGISLKTALSKMGIEPDVLFDGVDMASVYRPEMEYFSSPMEWIHRRNNQMDFYFITNQDRESKEVEITFRITGKVPEIWDPATGEMNEAESWHVKDGQTIVRQHFDPAESLFFVFRKEAGKHEAGEVTRKTLKVETLAVLGTWTLSFPPKLGAPDSIKMNDLASLSSHAIPGIKYFSGTVTYRNRFNLTEVPKAGKIELDLGSVHNLAEVWINNEKLAVLWKPPFNIDITRVVRSGENNIRVDVTNTWKNRLIGDAGLPEQERIGWTLARETWFDPATQPEPAGLLGPLQLIHNRK